MSRSWTEDECRAIGKVLKEEGIISYDYDEFCRLWEEGKIFVKRENDKVNKT